MSAEEPDIVEVLQLPNPDTLIIGACKEDVSIDSHASDGVLVTAKLSDVVIGSNVPDVDLLVTASNHYVAVTTLLLICRVFWISIELQTEDLRAGKAILLFLIGVPERHGHAPIAFLRDLGVIDHHL